MSESTLVSMRDEDALLITKNFLMDGVVLNFNVYIKMKPGTYLVIGKKGTVSTISKLHAVNSGASLYVHKDDHSAMVTNNFNMTERIVKAETLTSVVKVKYVQSLVTEVMDEVFNFGVGSSSYESIRKVGAFITEVSAQIEDLDEIFKLLQTVSSEAPRHSMATAIISLMIAEEMSITLKSALEKITLGALLHDVGLKEIPQSILAKPRRLWTEEEVLYYESHPRRGVEMLKGLPQISDDVFSIIIEHHENSQGTGYPRRIRDIKTNPLARIVALADCVSDVMYGEAKTDEPVTSLDQVIQYIEFSLGQPFHKPAFSALKNLSHKQHIMKKKTGS